MVNRTPNMPSDFTNRRNARIRGEGYAQSRNKANGGEIFLIIGIVYLFTWIAPGFFLYDLFHNGWSGTIHDFTIDKDGSTIYWALIFTGASAVLDIWTIKWAFSK